MTVKTSTLRVGDTFRCAEFANAVYSTRWVGGDLVPDKRRLCFDSPTVHYTRRETRPGGWARETEQKLDLRATDPSRGAAVFRVTKRAVAHGPPSSMGAGDSAPSGWRITAERVGGAAEVVEFHTSSDFIDEIVECEIVKRAKEPA